MRLFHMGRRAADGSLAPPLPRSVAGRATKCLREMALVGEAAGSGKLRPAEFSY